MTRSKLLRRFLGCYRPHKGLVAPDIGCAVTSGLLELGFPLAVSSVVDRLLPGRDWPLILLASAALLVVYVVGGGSVTPLSRDRPAEDGCPEGGNQPKSGTGAFCPEAGKLKANSRVGDAPRHRRRTTPFRSGYPCASQSGNLGS